MFAPADIDKDPALLLELKEEVREECEAIGQVTACTLFDVSPDLSRNIWLESKTDWVERGRWGNDCQVQGCGGCSSLYRQDERAIL